MALPERDAIAEQANLTQRVKTELKSQLNFGAEWGSLMEGDAKPGATIEDEIVRRKQQLKQMEREYARRLKHLQASEAATAAAAADEDGDLPDELVKRLGATSLRTEAQDSMGVTGGKMSSLEKFKSIPDPKLQFRRVQKQRAAELGI